MLGGRTFSVVGASALRISASDATSARLGLLWTIIDEAGAAQPTGGGVGIFEVARRIGKRAESQAAFCVKAPHGAQDGPQPRFCTATQPKITDCCEVIPTPSIEITP